MEKPFRILVAMYLFIPMFGWTQQTVGSLCLPGSLPKLKDTAGGQTNNNFRLNAPLYFALLGNDLKKQITAPFHLKSRDWGKLAEFSLLSVGVGFADEPVQQFTLNLRKHNKGLVTTS